MNINIYQRIVLIVGGVLFVIAIITAPTLWYWRELGFDYGKHPVRARVPQKETNTIIYRALIVWGITIPMFLALSNIETKKKRNKKENISKD